jgi:ribonuclease HI/exonuclease III
MQDTLGEETTIASTHQSLKILQYNVQKSYTTMQEVLLDKRSWQYDVIAIQEPNRMNWKDVPTTTNPAADRYHLFYPPYQDTRVCLFITKRIPIRKLRTTNLGPDLTAVTITTEDTERTSITIFNIYNPKPEAPYHTISGLPISSTLPKLSSALRNSQQSTNSNIVVGDINLHHEEWGGDGIITNHRRSAEYLIEIMHSHRLLISTPTAIVTRPSERGIENIGSTIDLCMAEADINESLIRIRRAKIDGDSDHLPIEIEFGINRITTEEPRERRQWRKMDREVFITHLTTELDKIPTYQGTVTRVTIETQALLITKAIVKAIEEGVPRTRITPYSKPGWTIECTEALAERKRLRRQYQISRTVADLIEWQKARRTAFKIIKKIKRDQHRERVSKAKDINGLWKLAKWLKNKDVVRSSFTPDIINTEGIPQTTTEGKAAAFKTVFFPKPPEADLTDIANYQYSSPLYVPRLEEHEIANAIKALKADKAPGSDDISNRALKEGIKLLTPRLTQLYRECLLIGYCPSQFKQSITVVIRKPGKADYTTPKSYRPIALLNTIGKILDKVLAKRILYLAESCQLLPATHMGGRQASSTEHALHLCVERIKAAWQSGITTTASMLLLDVSGAYDNVSHTRLIHCLRKRRIPESIIAYLTSFLEDRTTEIALSEGTSNKFTLTTGIPQGSPISPILYLFYNADLLEIAKGESKSLVTGYIDDTNLIAEGKDTTETIAILQGLHHKAEQWANRAASVFAPAKYRLIHFTPPKHLRKGRPQAEVDEDTRRPLILQLANGSTQQIEPEQEITYLGIRLNTRLIGDSQRRHVIERATKQIAALSAIGASTWGLKVTELRQIYRMVIIPRMLFGISLWYQPEPGHGHKGWNRKTVAELSKIQHTALCRISGAFKTTAKQALEVELAIPPIDITLRRNTEIALVRVLASPVTKTITRIRQWATLGRSVAKLGPPKYKDMTPLQQFEQRYHKQSDIPLEVIQPGCFTPWEEAPEVTIVRSYQNATKNHDAIHDMAKRDDTHLIVYTDGSLINSQVGSAAYAPKTDTQAATHMGTSKVSHIAAAEVRGITLACSIALQHKAHPLKKLTIFADSQAALQAIKNPHNQSGQYLLRECWWLMQNVKRKGIDLTLHWIPSHEGIRGNEQVDELAKRAAGHGRSNQRITAHPNLRRLQSALKTQLIKETNQEWTTRWDTTNVGRALHRHFPRFSPKKGNLASHTHLKKGLSSILTQLRTGKIALRTYLKRIGKTDTSTCQCGAEDQTPEHLLLHCSRFNDLRKEIWPTGQPNNKKELTTEPKQAERSAKFIYLTGLLGQFKEAKTHLVT